MRVIRATPDYPNWQDVHTLIAVSFAYMAERLGHPPKAIHLSPAQLAAEASSGSVLLMLDNNQPVGCLFCRASRDHENALYLGKLAVATEFRGAGLARQLIHAAAQEARSKNFSTLTLDTGLKLPELHTAFQRLGFSPPKTQADNPDIVTMTRAVLA